MYKGAKYLPAVLIVAASLLLAGCYTKFYRPGMEMGEGEYGTLYDRYDSTAIDTTLTAEDWGGGDYYPDTYDSWYYWGRPRGVTRWGFDFYNFSPGYYWSYYGYYDYYGVPWWHNSYRNYPWWYSDGGRYTPSEPPSQRPGGRTHTAPGGGSVVAPGGTGGGSVAAPQSQSSGRQTAGGNDAKKSSGDSDANKRKGGRGR